MMVMGGADLKRWLGQLNNENAQGEFYLTDVIAMPPMKANKLEPHPNAVEVERCQ